MTVLSWPIFVCHAAIEPKEVGDVVSIVKSTNEITWEVDDADLSDNTAYSFVKISAVLDAAGSATRRGDLVLTMGLAA